jgi:gliding motility-associated lipoprotein GldH
MKIRNNILLFFVVICFFSCDKKRVFDQYKSVGNSWNKDSLVSFELPELQKNKKYNLFLNIRSNNDYAFNNIFLIVSMEQPNKKTLVDTLEYQMANPDGTLLGDGFSDTKESKLAYKNNVSFNLKGKYKVKIQQANRQTGKVNGVKNLNGITEVGFRIESQE